MEERERRMNQPVLRRRRAQADDGGNQATRTLIARTPANTDKKMSRQASARGNGELELKNVRCFRCHKKVMSPDKMNKELSRMIQAERTTRSTSTGA